jgi:hypothetical protein
MCPKQPLSDSHRVQRCPRGIWLHLRREVAINYLDIFRYKKLCIVKLRLIRGSAVKLSLSRGSMPSVRRCFSSQTKLEGCDTILCQRTYNELIFIWLAPGPPIHLRWRCGNICIGESRSSAICWYHENLSSRAKRRQEHWSLRRWQVNFHSLLLTAEVWRVGSKTRL